MDLTYFFLQKIESETTKMSARLCYLSLMIFLTSCGSLKCFDKAPPDVWQYWKKSSVRKDEVLAALRHCGYAPPKDDLAVEQCMLDSGFTFIEPPCGAVCDSKENADRPSCKSLKTID